VRVLVVEDQPKMARLLQRGLRDDGFVTDVCGSGEDALWMAGSTPYDAVVLDVMLPGIDGLALCRWIRSRSSLPVILLTARGDEVDRIVGLELGADDYVTKPFSPRELAARVRTVLRRIGPQVPREERLTAGELVIDGATREVTKAGRAVQLTAKEFDLLRFLAGHPRRVFSRDQLMSRVWGYEAAYDTGTLTVHIRRLREKLEDDPSRPQLLQTVWGVGYRFSPL
jgi:DNA-binding response OmpR family regulator